MKTVVDNFEVKQKVGDQFVKSLTRHFDVSCKVDGRGTLVCQFSSKPLFRKPGKVFIRVPGELVDNHGYLQAVIDTGVRKLINHSYDRF
jgi:hypothetical protein